VSLFPLLFSLFISFPAFFKEFAKAVGGGLLFSFDKDFSDVGEFTFLRASREVENLAPGRLKKSMGAGAFLLRYSAG
jgi:hypothetical protein